MQNLGEVPDDQNLLGLQTALRARDSWHLGDVRDQALTMPAKE